MIFLGLLRYTFQVFELSFELGFGFTVSALELRLLSLLLLIEFYSLIGGMKLIGIKSKTEAAFSVFSVCWQEVVLSLLVWLFGVMQLF